LFITGVAAAGNFLELAITINTVVVGSYGKFRWNCPKLQCHVIDFLPKIPRHILKNAGCSAQNRSRPNCV